MAEPLRCDIPAPADQAQLYELLVSELTDFVVFLIDPTGCITSWNPGVQRILGYTEVEWLGRPAHIIFTPEDRAAKKPEEEMTTAARDGRAPDIRWHQKKDGSRLFVEGTIVALKDSTGQLLGFSKVMRDITQRKKAEEELRESEERFRAFVTASSDVVYQMSADWSEMFHLRGRDFIADTEDRSRTWLEKYIHPDDQARVTAAIKEAIRTKTPFELEHRVIQVDGTLGWTFSRAIPLLDAEGNIAEWLGAARDVTERKQADAALRASEAKYRALFESLDEGFCIIQMIFDEKGEAYDYRYLEANSVFKQQSGLVDVIGRTIREFVPDHEEYWLNAFGKVALTGERVRFENYAAALNRWFDVYAFRSGAPEEGKVAILFKDVTAQKTAEAEREGLLQQIGAERQRLKQVFAQAPVAIAVFRGHDLVVELANPVYQALLQGRDLVGRRFADVMPDLGQEVWDVFHGVMDTGEPYTANEWYIPYDYDQDGVLEDHWFNVAYYPLREPDGTVSGFVSVLTEVTTQVLARQELERVNRGLEEFAHVASHDLQEPLRMVNSYSQLLIRRLGQEATDEQKEFAGFIQRGVKRMEQLIRDLLAYSRTVHTVGETAASEASLDDALRQALTAVSTRVTDVGATITYDPLPAVRGDTAQLTHVFQNLLSNALKYRKATSPPRIHITARRRESDWVISVRDNGIGFDPGQAERIFGLFKRLHREDEYPGTGLGLAICRRIIERYGGKMWAESKPGVGSTFYFSLPLVVR